VTLTTEQRTKIRETVLAGRNVPRVNNVNFSISVGTRVPRSVRVVAVPETLIAIHPEWRGHRYFVIRDDIVIVDRDYSIVAVVPTGSSGGEAARLDDGGGTLDLSSDEIREVQIALKAKGFDVEVDGVLGTRTRRALIAFQRQQGFQVSGRIDSRTVTALGVSSKIGQQGNQRGSQPSTTGQGSDQMQKSPADQKQGAGAQGNESGSQPSTTGQGDEKMQKSPADQKQGGSQSSTTGQGSDKMQKSPADANQAPQNKNPDGSNK
jgi:peptidoglycan hydrolase-like protein with peptidoglycan-binding domain